MTGWLAGLGVLLVAGAGGALACRKRTVRPEAGGGSDVWWMNAVMIVVPVLALTGMSLVVLLAVLDTGQSGVRVEVIKTVLGVGAGAGAIVALVLAGRRQWTAERVAADAKLDAAERRVTELYTKAVEQLGSDKAAVRLGGLYALERLGQDTSQRQAVVNVICAYLRMPFTPPQEFDALNREDGQPKNSQPNSDGSATIVDD
jgi:hypothetical protein